MAGRDSSSAAESPKPNLLAGTKTDNTLRTFMCLAGCRVAVSRPSLKFILCEHFLNFKCSVDCLFCMWDRRQPEDENRPKLISKHRFSNSSCRASLCLSVLAAHIPAVYLL